MAGILESLTANLTISKYGDWQIFVERLNEAIRAGTIKEVLFLGQIIADAENNGSTIPSQARYIPTSSQTLQFIHDGDALMYSSF